MNKHLIVSGIAVLFICVGLSGCTEQSTVTDDSDKIELLDYNVKTSWSNTNDNGEFVSYEESGFYHNYPSEGEWISYVITGTVKNIAGRLLNTITVTAEFYDEDGNYLSQAQDNIFGGIANSYEEDFEIIVYTWHTQYFDNIESVSLSVKEGI